MTAVDVALTDHDQLTDRLLRGAIEVFSERGLDKAGVAAIARRAGVTTGAIYSRWSGKQEMLLDALDLVMAEEVAMLLDSGPGAAVSEILESLGADLLDRDAAADALLMEALAAARRDDDFRIMLLDRVQDQEKHLARVIEQGKDDGLVDPGLSTEAIVTLCHAISLGFVTLASIQKPLPDVDGWSTVIRRVVSAALPESTPASIPPLTPHKEQP